MKNFPEILDYNSEYDLNILRKISEKDILVSFTNGCFDVLHAGHLHLFETARKMSDFLVVALNTDESYYRLRNKKPINNLDYRIYQLSRIKDISTIITFSEEEDLAKIIRILDPDFYVKELSTLPRESGSEALYNGTMVYIKAKYNVSTTKILETGINRINDDKNED